MSVDTDHQVPGGQIQWEVIDRDGVNPYTIQYEDIGSAVSSEVWAETQTMAEGLFGPMVNIRDYTEREDIPQSVVVEAVRMQAGILELATKRVFGQYGRAGSDSDSIMAPSIAEASSLIKELQHTVHEELASGKTEIVDVPQHDTVPVGHVMYDPVATMNSDMYTAGRTRVAEAIVDGSSLYQRSSTISDAESYRSKTEPLVALGFGVPAPRIEHDIIDSASKGSPVQLWAHEVTQPHHSRAVRSLAGVAAVTGLMTVAPSVAAHEPSGAQRSESSASRVLTSAEIDNVLGVNSKGKGSKPVEMPAVSIESITSKPKTTEPTPLLDLDPAELQESQETPKDILSDEAPVAEPEESETHRSDTDANGDSDESGGIGFEFTGLNAPPAAGSGVSSGLETVIPTLPSEVASVVEGINLLGQESTSTAIESTQQLADLALGGDKVVLDVLAGPGVEKVYGITTVEDQGRGGVQIDPERWTSLQVLAVVADAITEQTVALGEPGDEPLPSELAPGTAPIESSPDEHDDDVLSDTVDQPEDLITIHPAQPDTQEPVSPLQPDIVVPETSPEQAPEDPITNIETASGYKLLEMDDLRINTLFDYTKITSAVDSGYLDGLYLQSRIIMVDPIHNATEEQLDKLNQYKELFEAVINGDVELVDKYESLLYDLDEEQLNQVRESIGEILKDGKTMGVEQEDTYLRWLVGSKDYIAGIDPETPSEDAPLQQEEVPDAPEATVPPEPAVIPPEAQTPETPVPEEAPIVAEPVPEPEVVTEQEEFNSEDLSLYAGLPYSKIGKALDSGNVYDSVLQEGLFPKERNKDLTVQQKEKLREYRKLFRAIIVGDEDTIAELRGLLPKLTDKELATARESGLDIFKDGRQTSSSLESDFYSWWMGYGEYASSIIPENKTKQESAPQSSGVYKRLAEMGTFRYSGENPNDDRVGEWKNIAYIHKRFVNAGYTANQATGFVSNCIAESGCNPTRNQNNGPAYGIFMWEGPRKAQLLKLKDHDKLSVQVDFALSELRGTEARARRLIKETSSARGATRTVSEEFERPGTPHMDVRLGVSDQVEKVIKKTREEIRKDGNNGSSRSGETGGTVAQRAKRYAQELGISVSSVNTTTDGWAEFHVKKEAAIKAVPALKNYNGYPKSKIGLPKEQRNTADSNGMYWGECVSWVMHRVDHDKKPGDAPRWAGTHGDQGKYGVYGGGNAKGWIANAKAEGIPVNDTPAVGAVLVSTLGTYGHVMYVEKVLGDGSVFVSQMNEGGTGDFSTEVIPIEQLDHKSLDGSMAFVHLEKGKGPTQ